MPLALICSFFIVTPTLAAEPTTEAACNSTEGHIWEGEQCKTDPCYGNVIQVNCNGGEGGGIFEVLNLVVNALSVGVVVAATAGVIFAALRYTQARDNAESAAGAKKMIINIIIGLIVWAVFWVILQWIMPGGMFRDAP
jgi:hypothetical protein